MRPPPNPWLSSYQKVKARKCAEIQHADHKPSDDEINKNLARGIELAPFDRFIYFLIKELEHYQPDEDQIK